LTVQELAIATEVSRDPKEPALDDIDFDAFSRNLCTSFAGILTVDENEVVFGHDDFRELQVEGEQACESQDKITTTCLHYLCLEETTKEIRQLCDQHVGLDQSPWMQNRTTLVSYAVQSWPHHYKLGRSDALTDRVLAFLNDSEVANTWTQALYILSNPITRLLRSYTSPLPYIASLGLDDLLERQMAKDKGHPLFGTDCELAVTEAARHGHDATLRLLMKACRPSHQTLHDAIAAAAAFGPGGALDSILECMTGIQDFQWPEYILSRAATVGLDELARVVIRSGHPVDERDFLEIPALHTAVNNGQLALVKVLVESNADVDLPFTDGGTALQDASGWGRPDIVKVLLDSGAKVDIEDNFHSRPLQTAVFYGRAQVLELLIGAGADINKGRDDLEAEVSAWPPVVIAAHFNCTYLRVDGEAARQGSRGRWTYEGVSYAS
jgi:ankyrin repeat protein